MEKIVVFFSNVELWSISENQGGRAQISTVRNYISSGWRVFYVSTTGKTPNEIREQATVIETNFDAIRRIAFSKCKVLHFFKYLNHFFIYRFFYKIGKKIIRELGNRNIILYAYEVDAVLPVKRLARKNNIPFVTRFQGTVHNKTDDNWLNRLRFFPHLQALKTEADIVIMTDDGTQGLKTLRRLGNKTQRVFFWRNGVANIDVTDDAIRAFREANGTINKYVFLTVSRLVNWKRVDRAISSFSIIANDFPNLELHVIGEGEEKESLMKLASDLGVSSKVIFHGAVNQSDVFLYMCSSNAFLSLYDLSNVGNPLLEAMRVGMPIITLDNGDTSTIIQNDYNGIMLQESQIQDIPNKMVELITNPSKARYLGENAKEFAQSYFWTWEERMEKEIQEVSSLLLSE